jgi:hypothetical protein
MDQVRLNSLLSLHARLTSQSVLDHAPFPDSSLTTTRPLLFHNNRPHIVTSHLQVNHTIACLLEAYLSSEIQIVLLEMHHDTYEPDRADTLAWQTDRTHIEHQALRTNTTRQSLVVASSTMRFTADARKRHGKIFHNHSESEFISVQTYSTPLALAEHVTVFRQNRSGYFDIS